MLESFADGATQLPPAWKRTAARPLVLGHRGARHAAPENTLAAFELARLEGAEGTELDVQLSRDGVVVVVHDLDLARVTRGAERGRVAELTAAELERVQLGEGSSVPRLSQVLDWAKRHGMLLNVELKSDHPRSDALVPQLAQLLTQYPDAAEWVLVSSFHPWLLGRFRLAAPRVPSAFIVGRHHPRLFAAAWLRLLGCQAVHPQAGAVLSNARLRELGQSYALNTWTVNDPNQALTLANLGVNALISDCPGQLLSALGKNR